MPETALASFTGITSLRAARFPLSRGVTPSLGVLYVVPQDGLDIPDGTLRFTQGNSLIQLSGCAIANAYVRHQYDGKWPIWAVYVVDRRYKWAGKIVSGDWNRRASDGTLDTTTQKTPAELATLLLQALGESGFDVSRMPSGIKPRAKWVSVRADLALQTLCDYVACEVVLNHLTDKIEIWPLGLGITAPTNQNELLPKYRFVPRANVPSTIQVIGGPSLFQTKLKLAAVTRNYSDGKQKKLADAEAKPTTGWDKESWLSFPGVATVQQTNSFEGVWRDYRIIGQQDGTIAVPNCPSPVSSIDQYQLTDTLLETETDLEGYKRNLPCYVDGDYWSYADLPTNVSGQRYTGQFTLYKDRRVVSFPYPMFKTDSSGGFAEPTLYLTTSYMVLDNTNSLVAIKRSGNVGGSGGTLVLRRPELFAIYSTSTTPGAQTNTEAQANTEADAYITLFQQRYVNPLAAEIRYPGLVPMTLDGNIAQISWSWAVNRQPETMVCEQEELDTSSISRNERRRAEVLASLQEKYL